MRSILFQAHWLVGITAGIVLALCGVTGAMLSFEDQIVASLNDEARIVSPRSSAVLSPGQLVARVEAANPQSRIVSLTVFGDSSLAARVTLAGTDQGAGEATRYANPYTGSFSIEAGDRGEAFFRSVRGLHRWLMLGEWGDRDVGRQIVGASTLLLVLLCTTGLYLRWPRNGHSFREWLVPNFSLRGRSFLHSLHVVLATWALLIYFVVALTGLQWSYEWYRDGLYAFAGVERVERPGRGQRNGATWPDLSRSWNAFLRETEQSGFSRATIQPPRARGGAFEIRYLEPNPAHPRAYNVLALDPASGALVRHERYAEKEAGGKLVASIFALHSGQFFGTPGVLAFMLASLAMPVFAVTGWMLYLDRRRRKARSRMRLGLTAVTQPR